MSDLQNSNRDLLEGLVNLLRENVDGWSENNKYGVQNVWTSDVPEPVNNEFPRGIVDIISGDDTDLSIELDIRLREVIVKVVVFGENSGNVENLIDQVEDEIANKWEEYIGDWSMREIDGFTPLNETEGSEGMLRYSRSIDIVFETTKMV